MTFDIVSCTYLMLCSNVFHIGNVFPNYQSGGDSGHCEGGFASGFKCGYQAEENGTGAGEQEAVVEREHQNQAHTEEDKQPYPVVREDHSR